MYQIKIILIISLFLAGCSLKGVYQLKSYNTDIELLLKEDKSFIKSINVNSETDTFYGKWSHINDTLFLSILKPHVFFNKQSLSIVKESVLPDDGKIYFEVYYDNNDTAAFTHIRLDEKVITTGPDGKASINKTDISEIHVSSLNTLAYKDYKIKDKRSNHFEIVLHYKDVSSVNVLRVEPTTKYIVKGKKLIPIGKKNNRKKYYLKRN